MGFPEGIWSMRGYDGSELDFLKMFEADTYDRVEGKSIQLFYKWGINT